MKNLKTHAGRMITLMGAFASLTIGAGAQVAPCPTPPKPYAPLMLDVSRNITNTKVDTGVTYFGVCQANGEKVRYTYHQPLRMELTAITPCDEFPVAMYLDGYYSSQTRLNDPMRPNANMDRIGWHNGWANVKDASGAVIGYATFEGTIGTNTSRAPLAQSSPNYDCYVCGHHTGIIRITFTQTTGANLKLGVIRAFYQFDAIYAAGAACDQLDPCFTSFFVQSGTLDGINLEPCH